MDAYRAWEKEQGKVRVIYGVARRIEAGRVC